MTDDAKVKDTDQRLQEFNERIESFEEFLEDTLQELLEIVGDDPRMALLLPLSIKSSGTAEAFRALQEHGPMGVIFFMMAEGERLVKGVEIRSEMEKGGTLHEAITSKCSKCEDKEECDAYNDATPPVDEDGDKILR